MALKNYTTKVPASRSVQEIQEMLQKHGAAGSMMEYEPGTGKIASLAFRLTLSGQNWDFRLPLRWREAQRIMQEQGISKAYDDDYCYRVAWRILRDWVDIQMALVEIEIVQIQEFFLPYVVQKNGLTLYENIVTNPGLLLNSGKAE
jgi:hypothetical protein